MNWILGSDLLWTAALNPDKRSLHTLPKPPDARLCRLLGDRLSEVPVAGEVRVQVFGASLSFKSLFYRMPQNPTSTTEARKP